MKRLINFFERITRPKIAESQHGCKYINAYKDIIAAFNRNGGYAVVTKSEHNKVLTKLLRYSGIETETRMMLGNPSREIIEVVNAHEV